MKKLALLSAVALGLAFTACDDNDIIDIPVNQEPVIFQTDNLQISAAAQTQSVLDLKTLNDNAENITVADIALTNFPADYELNVVMQISADENFSRIAEVPATVANNTVTVSPDDLQGVYQSNISKSPKQRTIWARYAAYAVKDQASVRIGDPDYFYGPFQLQVLPIPSSFVIEQNYYLLGTVNGWSVAQAIKLNHSDKDVYDDPVFSRLTSPLPTPPPAGGGRLSPSRPTPQATGLMPTTPPSAWPRTATRLSPECWWAAPPPKTAAPAA